MPEAPRSWCGGNRRVRWMPVEPLHERVDELPAALAIDGGQRENRAFPAIRFDEVGDPRLPAVGLKQIELVQYQPARLLKKRLVVALEFLDDRARFGDRIDCAVERREVDHVQQQARALQMAQEAMAESGAV